MNTEIPYSGHAVTPDDYTCPDGQLALSLNLIHEDGHLKPIPQPAPVLTLTADERLLFIHHVAGKENPVIILSRPSLSGEPDAIHWIEMTTDLDDTSAAKFISHIHDIVNITAIGNTLIFATEHGLRYLIWRDNDYTPLDSKPPFIPIAFGLKQIRSSTYNDIQDEIAFPDELGGSAAQRFEKEDIIRAYTELSNAVHGLINSHVADNITSKGYFYQPFFIRYAFRLFDGSYSWHSAPVLMLPTVTPPIVKITDKSGGKAKITLDMNHFQLNYHILDHPTIADWKELIAGVDVFVSAPVYTYDQSRDIEFPVSKAYSLMLKSLVNYYGWKGRPGISGSSDTDPEASISVFTGHYAAYNSDNYIDHCEQVYVNQNYSDEIINIPLHPRFHDNIRSTSNFYKIASLDFDDLATMDEMKPLPLTESDLSSLVAREPLTDDFRSHCPLVAESLFAFNSRLNLAGISLSPAEPLPLRSCVQFANAAEGNAPATVKVWSRIDGVRCYAVNSDNSFANGLSDPATEFPRYIFYPDASAYKMEFAFSSGKTVRINLTPHDFLNGAYYYNSTFLADTTPENAAPETTDGDPDVSLPSKIYTSEAGNPFLFPATGINTVGSGKVMALSSAARALSQGQFGQFPLYAFTSEGVWALEVGSTGAYVARQPITRDVCVNPAAITQIDSAVLFPTSRGIMMLSGADAQCITDPVNTDTPFDILSLPAISQISDLMKFPTRRSPLSALKPFTDFLADCGMIYDYPGQRIIIYSRHCDYDYAYIYSLRSHQWGIMDSDLSYSVNSYPEALAVDRHGHLVDFSRKFDIQPSQLLITRPLKLDAPDVLKTVDTVIQRGMFPRGSVSSVLYGSRDLSRWHLITSSTGHTLRGFSGTPYRYFRIALISDLCGGEYISRASVSFRPRLTDKLR